MREVTESRRMLPMNSKLLRFYVYSALAIACFGLADFLGSRVALGLFVLTSLLAEFAFWGHIFKRHESRVGDAL